LARHHGDFVHAADLSCWSSARCRAHSAQTSLREECLATGQQGRRLAELEFASGSKPIREADSVRKIALMPYSVLAPRRAILHTLLRSRPRRSYCSSQTSLREECLATGQPGRRLAELEVASGSEPRRGRQRAQNRPDTVLGASASQGDFAHPTAEPSPPQLLQFLNTRVRVVSDGSRAV
jgi:hypothetical protein